MMVWHFRVMMLWVIALMGCAAYPPEKPVIVEYTQAQRSAAMEYALTKNLVLQALVDQCQPINDSARVYAQQVQQHWWQTNWPLVAAANAEMEAQTQEQQLRLGDITGQLLLIRFIYLAEQRSVTHLMQDIKKSTNGENTCRIHLDPYANGQQDLQDSEHGPVLTFIMQTDYPQVVASAPRLVPQVVNRFKAEYNVGRSLYEVEKIVRERLCPVPEVLNVFNRWPREMYGAYCEKKDPSLIVCEWGECTVISGL